MQYRPTQVKRFRKKKKKSVFPFGKIKQTDKASPHSFSTHHSFRKRYSRITNAAAFQNPVHNPSYKHDVHYSGIQSRKYLSCFVNINQNVGYLQSRIDKFRYLFRGTRPTFRRRER